jgi:hypothetical protein
MTCSGQKPSAWLRTLLQVQLSPSDLVKAERGAATGCQAAAHFLLIN